MGIALHPTLYLMATLEAPESLASRCIAKHTTSRLKQSAESSLRSEYIYVGTCSYSKLLVAGVHTPYNLKSITESEPNPNRSDENLWHVYA